MSQLSVMKIEARVNLKVSFILLEDEIFRTIHQTDEFDTRPFNGGSGRRVVAKTSSVASKMLWASPGDKPNLSRDDLSLGNGLLRFKEISVTATRREC